MSKRFLQYCLACVFTCCVVSSALALEQYLCIGEKSTGFKLIEGKWEMVRFTTAKINYLVKEVLPFTSADGKSVKFVVQRIGEKEDYLTCTRGTIGDYVSPYIHCGHEIQSIIVHTERMRFNEYFGYGYVDGDESIASPSLTIGTCKKL